MLRAVYISLCQELSLMHVQCGDILSCKQTPRSALDCVLQLGEE